MSYLCSAPYTLLPLRGISPQGETRDMERKTGRHILHVPFRCVPLWWLAPPPSPPQAVGLWVLSNGAMSLQESIERFILPPLAGEVRRSRIGGGGERSEPISRMLIMSYDTARSSRNADFISIAREGNPQPSAPQALSPPERSDATLLHNPRRQPRPFFITCGVSRHHNPRPRGLSNP